MTRCPHVWIFLFGAVVCGGTMFGAPYLHAWVYAVVVATSAAVGLVTGRSGAVLFNHATSCRECRLRRERALRERIGFGRDHHFN